MQFKKNPRKTEDLIQIIQENIKLKLVGLRVKGTKAVVAATRKWGLKWDSMASVMNRLGEMVTMS